MNKKNSLVWLDCEMSGLDPDRHVILEIAVVVTDGDLNILAEGPDLAIHHPAGALRSMESWSRKHHAKSGLLKEVAESSVSCAGAEAIILERLGAYCRKGVSPLCGKTIGHDRRFLARHMPRLHEFFHYRSIDVTAVKELVKRWYPAKCRFPVRRNAHRALDDTRAAIEELAFYRDTIFKPAN